MRGLMVSAMASGEGKTTLACGLMAALKRRCSHVQGFKCGPDYIDPMFHTKVLEIPSYNLDLFLQGETGVRQTYAQAARAGTLAIVEGAMGFYDGVGGTELASAWSVADCLNLPVILAVRPKGASLTLAAQIKGMMEFRNPSHIAALILTNCKPGLYAYLAPILERETGLSVLGYLPPMEEASLPSRHLGLMTAQEISDIRERFEAIGTQIEQTVDLDRLAALAGGETEGCVVPEKLSAACTIGVARDEAFCFYYTDNLEGLERAGAKLFFFSPLRDTVLPDQVDGLYLGGGYPEVYAKGLGENKSMRESIRSLVNAGLPTVAECGGFLYLQDTLEDENGMPWPMAGVLHGAGYRTQQLRRFGYAQLTAREDSLLFRQGEQVPAHEFHYWDCTENGEGLLARKPLGDKSWSCGVLTGSLYAGFPHLHFGGELPLAQRFVQAAVQWRREHEQKTT